MRHLTLARKPKRRLRTLCVILAYVGRGPRRGADELKARTDDGEQVDGCEVAAAVDVTAHACDVGSVVCLGIDETADDTLKRLKEFNSAENDLKGYQRGSLVFCLNGLP